MNNTSSNQYTDSNKSSILGTSPTNILETTVKVSQTSLLVKQVVGLIGFIVVMGGILIYASLTMKQLPHWLPYAGGLTIVIVSIVQIIQIRNIKNSLTTKDIKAVTPTVEQLHLGKSVATGEKVLGYVAGIFCTYRPGIGNVIGQRRSSVFYKTTDLIAPENALVITSKHIYFVYIPVIDNGDKNVIGQDMGQYYMMTRKDVEAKLKEMLDANKLKEVVESHPKNYAMQVSDIRSVNVGKWITMTVTFNLKNGDHANYNLSQSGQKDEIKNLISPLLS